MQILKERKKDAKKESGGQTWIDRGRTESKKRNTQQSIKGETMISRDRETDADE